MKQVGSGLYGSVYKCRSTEDGQYYALKEFLKSRVKASLNENQPDIAALLSFDHPNVARVRNIIHAMDKVYFVMHYLSSRYGRSIDYQLR